MTDTRTKPAPLLSDGVFLYLPALYFRGFDAGTLASSHKHFPELPLLDRLAVRSSSGSFTRSTYVYVIRLAATHPSAETRR